MKNEKKQMVNNINSENPYYSNLNNVHKEELCTSGKVKPPYLFSGKRFGKIILAIILLYSIQCFPQTDTIAERLHSDEINITLDDALSSAVKNNEKIKQYYARYEEKKFQNLEAWGNFLPRVELSAGYTHLNDPLTMDLDPIRQAMITLQSSNQVEFANIYNVLGGQSPLNDQQRGALFNQYSSKLNSLLPEFKSVLKKQDYKSASVTAIQPLFTGGKILAGKMYAGIELDAAALELKQVQDEVRKETLQKYIAVVMLQEIVKVRTDVLSAVNRHKDRAGKMLKEGLIANYNFLRAQVAVADAEKNLDETNDKLELAYLDFKTTAGYDLEEEIIISDSLIYNKFADSLLSLTTAATGNNYILQLIEMKKSAVKQKYNAERSSFLPAFSLFGKYEMYPQYLSALEPRWTVGIAMNMNIFNGLKDYAKLQTADYLEEEIDHIYFDARKKISLLINKNFRDVVNSENNYTKNLKTIELASENLRLNEKRFDTGLGISLEVVDAYLAYEKAQIDSKNYLYNFYSSLAELYYNSGDINKAIMIINRKDN